MRINHKTLISILVFLFSCNLFAIISDLETEKNSLDKDEVLVERPSFVQTDYLKKWLDFYSTKNSTKRLFQTIGGAGPEVSPYSLVAKNLQKSDVSLDYIYLALAESGLNSTIKSPQGARGPWQLLGATARRFGLRVDKKHDERTDLEKSTVSVAKYLKYLHSKFNSFELVIVAYNCGERRVEWAIEQGSSTDFKKLAEKSLIPKESINLVYKIKALKLLHLDYLNNLKV